MIISGDLALEIEEGLADLLNVEPEEIQAWREGKIGESGNRKTGYRFIRGTHGGATSAILTARTFFRPTTRCPRERPERD